MSTERETAAARARFQMRMESQSNSVKRQKKSRDDWNALSKKEKSARRAEMDTKREAKKGPPKKKTASKKTKK